MKVAVDHGFVIILRAQGIDQQAHIEAIRCGGQSLAIIACGLDQISRRLLDLSKKGVGLASPFFSSLSSTGMDIPKT